MPTYQAFAFLQDDSDFDIEVLRQRLNKRFPTMKVVHEGRNISLQMPNWELRVHLADEPFVAQESLGISEHFAECPLAAEIAECKRRVEICSTDPDPEMEYFNDYIILCETLEGFRGVILFDPTSGELIWEQEQPNTSFLFLQLALKSAVNLTRKPDNWFTIILVYQI